MKWIFAGTSHGVPERNAFCSANFLTAGDKTYIFDAGGPVSPLLIQYGLRHDSVEAIFISHEHADHRDGLPELLNQFIWYYSRRSDKVHPTVFLPRQEEIDLITRYVRESNTAMPEWTEFMLAQKMKLVLYHAGVIFDDGTLRVTARKNEHTPYAHSFLIEAEGKRILHTADLGYGFPEYERILNDEEYDLVICESAHHDPGSVNDRLLKTKTRIMRLSHINPDRVAKLTEFVKQAPFDCAFAHDGMILEL